VFIAIANPGSKTKHGEVCGRAAILVYRFHILLKAAAANVTTIRPDFKLSRNFMFSLSKEDRCSHVPAEIFSCHAISRARSDPPPKIQTPGFNERGNGDSKYDNASLEHLVLVIIHCNNGMRRSYGRCIEPTQLCSFGQIFDSGRHRKPWRRLHRKCKPLQQRANWST
jgi:hypothetical protein